MVTPQAVNDDYVASTQEVLLAAKRLRSNLNKDIGSREFAVTQLEQAVKQQDAQGTSIRAFMFAEPADPEPDAVVPTVEDALQSIEIDLGVANLLLAAGATLGETGQKAPPQVLDEAVLQFETRTQGMEQAGNLSRFGFEDSAAAPAIVTSADLPTALENFRKQAEETLSQLVSDAQMVIGTIAEQLSNAGGEQVLDAIGKLNTGVKDLPKIGRLFRQGIEKIEQAIDALIRFLGSDVLESAKGTIETFWREVKEGKQVEGLLGRAFGIDTTRAHITSILGVGGLKTEALDRATGALKHLSSRFKGDMETARGIVTIVSIGGTVLALVPAIGPQAVLVALVLDALVLAWVLALGADYADHGDVLRRVAGVRKVADRARTG
jgi:hypothetical protein